MTLAESDLAPNPMRSAPTRARPAGTLGMRYSPRALVRAASVVPTTKTRTSAMGARDAWSVTVPATAPVACAPTGRNATARTVVAAHPV